MTLKDESYFKEKLSELNKEAQSGKGQVFETYAIHYTELVNSFAKNSKLTGENLRSFLSLAIQTGAYLSEKELAETEESLIGCCSHGIEPDCCPAGCGDLDCFQEEYHFSSYDDESDLTHNSEPIDSLLDTNHLDYRLRLISYEINSLTSSLCLDFKLTANKKAASEIFKIDDSFNKIRESLNLEPENNDFILAALSELSETKRLLTLQKNQTV